MIELTTSVPHPMTVAAGSFVFVAGVTTGIAVALDTVEIGVGDDVDETIAGGTCDLTT